MPKASKNETPADEEPTTFEASLRAIEQSVAALELGTLDLDEALAVYERTIKLLERCHNQLDSAEQRVAKLTGVNPDGSPRTEPLDPTGE